MGPPPTSSLRAIQSAAAGRDDGQYRELFELSPQVLWVYDPETLRFLAVNDAAVQGYGYTREEFHTMTIADIRPKEDVAAFMDHMDAAHPSSETTGGWRHRRKDGSLIDVEVSSRVVPLGSEFHAGFTLGSLGHVVVDDYATERRFNPTPLLRRHGAVSGIAVILGGRKRPIGVLAAHSRSPRQFTVDEVTFLQAVANV